MGDAPEEYLTKEGLKTIEENRANNDYAFFGCFPG
jgi:hypothetical protein